MIEETFEDVLREFDEFVEPIITTYHEGNMGGLKSAIHKIKPLFGFVGLTALQAQCLQFENSCLNMNAEELAAAFTPLKQNITDAKSIIEGERKRLAAFNEANG